MASTSYPPLVSIRPPWSSAGKLFALVALLAVVGGSVAACNLGSPTGGSPTATPAGGSPTATPTSPPPAPAGHVQISVQAAPGYAAGNETVDCSNIDWAVIVINLQNPNDPPNPPMDWNTTTGALADPNAPMDLTPGTAPAVVVAPASGSGLKVGDQQLVQISGSFTGGQYFGVRFQSPQESEGYDTLVLQCR